MTSATDSGNGFSYDVTAQVKSEAIIRIGKNTTANARLIEGIIDLDAAIVASAERNPDEWASVVALTGRLAGLLGEEGE